MLKLSTDRKISLAFLIAFAALAAVPLGVWENRERLTSARQWINHSRDVLDALDDALLAVNTAEANQRDYLLTRDERFVMRYQESAGRARDQLAQVAGLTSDNAEQQRRLDALKPRLSELLDRWQRAMNDRRAAGDYPSAEATEQLAAGVTGTSLDGREVERMLGDMQAAENRLLDERKLRLGTSMVNGNVIIWIVTALNFVTLGFSYYLVNRYMAHRRASERALKEVARAAEAASQAKSAFLANMSHEIRTPMTAIVGFADLLLDTAGNPMAERGEWLQTIRRNARHLLDLIHDVLDLSKIEAGKMNVERIDCDLPRLVGDVVCMMRPRALEKGLAFDVSFASPVPRQVSTDPLRLKQVLVNLLGNAIKFTQRGRVALRVSYGAAGGRLRFDVIDTGIGIAPDQLARLFQPFQQADESTTRRFGGSGLGLTISQRIAGLLDGAIYGASVPQRGSTFTLTLDVGPRSADALVEAADEAVARPSDAQAPAVAAAAAAPVLAARVLLAEDGHDNQRLITAHLRAAGAEVAVADNGRATVDLAARQPFDLILMDMQMPVMDGYAATAELRRRGVTIPIVALTAHAMTDDRAKCLAAGCSEYLSKPIERDLLIATLQRMLPAAGGTAATAAATARAAAAGVLRSSYAHEAEMRPLIAQFVEHLPGQVRELQQLLNGDEREALRRRLHQLKGSGGGYGFTPVTDAAARAEQAILEHQPIADITARVRELIGIITTIEGYDGSTNATQREAA